MLTFQKEARIESRFRNRLLRISSNNLHYNLSRQNQCYITALPFGYVKIK